jgi:hypothetical protein
LVPIWRLPALAARVQEVTIIKLWWPREEKVMHILNQRFVATGALALTACALLAGQTPDGEALSLPQAAAKVLVNAAKSDVEGAIKMLGHSSRDILVTDDPVADENARKVFFQRRRRARTAL